MLLWAEPIGKIYRIKEGCVDKSFFVILEWKQVLGHLDCENLPWLECRAQEGQHGQFAAQEAESRNPVVSAFGHCRTELQKQSSWAWPFKLRRPCLGPRAIFLLNHRISSSGVFLHLVTS